MAEHRSPTRPPALGTEDGELLTPTHHVTAIQNNPRTSIFSMIGGDEYESWYELAADLASPATSSADGPADLTSAEGRAHAAASVADFSAYLRTIGKPYDGFVANRRGPSASRSGEAAAPRAEPVSMEEVPSLVFDAGFALEDPATFAFFSPDGAPASTMLQQERLAHSLDLVEINLLHAVSTRSEDFYSALDSWHGLTESVAAGVQQIHELRATVAAIDGRLGRTVLRLPRLCRQRSNQLRLHRQLALIATVRTAQPTIQALLASDDYVGALELIGSTQAALRGELAGVRCFVHLDEELEQTAHNLTAVMVQDFVTTMTQGVARAIAAAGGASGGGARGGGAELEAVRARIAPLLLGLLRQRALAGGLGTFFESLRAEVKAVVKTRVAELLAEQARARAGEAGAQLGSGGEGGAGGAGGAKAGGAAGGAGKGSIAEQLIALPTASFLTVLAGVSRALLQIMGKAEIVSSALNAVLEARANARAERAQQGREAAQAKAKARAAAAAEGAAAPASNGSGAGGDGPAAPAPPADAEEEADTEARAECARRLCGLCEAAAERYAKLLSVRSDVHVRLPLAELVETHQAALGFASAVEGLVSEGAAPCAALRATLAATARAFADRVHEATKHKLSSTLDCERWSQADVPARFQLIADAVLRHVTMPPRELERLCAARPAGQALLVHGHAHRVVGSALLLLELLGGYGGYVSLVGCFPEVAVHLLPQLAELLGLFNSRAFQLVLGAGAIQLVGLQRISSKILALLTQSLGLLIALMPHLRASFALHLPTQQHAMLAQLDRSVHDLREHQRKVLSKLVSILLDRVDNSANSAAMHAALSGSTLVMPGQPSPYMAELVKDAQALHRVLQPILTPEQLDTVYSQILGGFDSKLLSIYSATSHAEPNVAHRITTDIAHLITAMMHLQPESTQLCCPQLARFAQSIASRN